MVKLQQVEDSWLAATSSNINPSDRLCKGSTYKQLCNERSERKKVCNKRKQRNSQNAKAEADDRCLTFSISCVAYAALDENHRNKRNPVWIYCRKQPDYDFCISQGSVATVLRWDMLN